MDDPHPLKKYMYNLSTPQGLLHVAGGQSAWFPHLHTEGETSPSLPIDALVFNKRRERATVGFSSFQWDILLMSHGPLGPDWYLYSMLLWWWQIMRLSLILRTHQWEHYTLQRDNGLGFCANGPSTLTLAGLPSFKGRFLPALTVLARSTFLS